MITAELDKKAAYEILSLAQLRVAVTFAIIVELTDLLSTGLTFLSCTTPRDPTGINPLIPWAMIN